MPNKKLVEGWCSEKVIRRRMEGLIENKKKDGVPNRKQVEGWSSRKETIRKIECLLGNK